MTDKQSLYNTVFSLIEEELYQRLDPSNYNDNIYNGTRTSICGTSNLDIASMQSEQKGGSNFIPGKFDVIRNSYHVPLITALKATVERQKLFLNK
jgi:hypothetical protein